jgi:cell division transport system ATP-binding protein
VITFAHVGLRYGPGPEVLSDISFTLAPGSFHFLTGPSGAGKTSLMRLIALALRPTRGVVTAFGARADNAPRAALAPLRRQIGMVFQDHRLLPQLSAFDNVALPLRIAGAPEGEVRAHVAEMLAWVGLADYAHMRPDVLSGGQAQRAAIARAVIARPRLVLADEPTGNLDDALALRIMALFEELGRLGTSVLIATHDRMILERFARHPRLVLTHGHLRVEGEG